MEEIFTPLGRMRQLFDLSEVPAALRDKVGGESALYLFDILLRLPSIDLDTVPGGPGFDAETGLERWSIPDTMIQIVRMEEGPRSGAYLFSSDVVENLPEWHALVRDRPTLRPTAYENWRTEQIPFTGPWFAFPRSTDG